MDKGGPLLSPRSPLVFHTCLQRTRFVISSELDDVNLCLLQVSSGRLSWAGLLPRKLPQKWLSWKTPDAKSPTGFVMERLWNISGSASRVTSISQMDSDRHLVSQVFSNLVIRLVSDPAVMSVSILGLVPACTLTVRRLSVCHHRTIDVMAGSEIQSQTPRPSISSL